MSTRLFHGYKGIAGGTILIFGVTFTLLPMNRHNPLLDALFIVGMLLALIMILIGVCTLGENSKKKQ
jgi:hypothetical protein